MRIGTIPHAAALLRARALRVGAQQLFEAVSRMKTIEEAEAAIEVWRANHAAAFAVNMLDHGRLYLDRDQMTGCVPGIAGDAGFGVDLLLRTVRREMLGEHLATVRRALAGDSSARDHLAPVIASALRSAGIKGDPTRRSMSILTVKALQAYATLVQELVAIGDGEPDALLKALRPSTAIGDLQQPEPIAVSVVRDVTVATHSVPPADQNVVDEITELTAEPAGAKLRRPAAKRVPAPSFDELWEAFIDEKIETLREWKKSRRPELTASGRLWTWLIGKEPALATSANIQEARNLYLWLPKGYDRARDYADRTPQQIVEAAKAAWQAENPGKRSAAAYPRISAKTFNKHLSN